MVSYTFKNSYNFFVEDIFTIVVLNNCQTCQQKFSDYDLLAYQPHTCQS